MDYVRLGQIELLMRLLQACGGSSTDVTIDFLHHAEHIPT